MKTNTKIAACLLMLAYVPCAGAAKQAGLLFTHNDWEIACDNTRTCRAAGYHSDITDGDDANAGSKQIPVSVLLTRKAGPREPVQAELQVGRPGGDPGDEEWLRPRLLTMSIDGTPAGTVVLSEDKVIFKLPAPQTSLLIAALTRQGRIEWSDGDHTWKLSDKGAAAVLLKMDEFQRRIGTSGALVRRGPKDETGVLPPLAAPVIQAATVSADDEVRLSNVSLRALRAALKPSMKDCTARPQATMAVRRLSATRLLASTTCWSGSYKEGFAYWVVNAKAPYSPQLITQDATDYSDGKIIASHRGSGNGDCLSLAAWTWDGKRFVHTSDGTTGACKSVAPGGAWSLPVLTTTVRPAVHPKTQR